MLLVSHLLKTVKDRGNASAFLRADGSLGYIREVLGPVLLEKPVRNCLGLENSLIPETIAFAVQVLAGEVARPLNPYPDWTRPCPPEGGRVGSAIIRELAAFMADPAAETGRFPRNQADRAHLENFIRDHSLDLDCTTITKGRPYTLVCQKNNKSYHRALARRAKDEELLRNLGG